MKKIILTAASFLALYATSLAGENKALLSSLTAALKNAQQVSWSSNETRNRAAFSFNGQTVFAFYNKEDENLVGYSFHINQSDLPQESQAAIAKKYAGWEITETIMFIDAGGYTSNYVSVKKGNKHLALKVTGKSLGIYSRIPE